ncbi:cysteine synthase, partial [Micromonospora endophytica]
RMAASEAASGTNLWGAFGLIAELLAAGRTGSVVTLICDAGDRYADTYYADDWVAAQALDLTPHLTTIDRFLTNGTWPS